MNFLYEQPVLCAELSKFRNSILRYKSYENHFAARTGLGHEKLARSAMKEYALQNAL
jgi:hypothetical protein